MDEDTAGLPLSEDTVADAPETPLPEAPETDGDLAPETFDDDAPETETSLFDEAELEEQASKDPVLRTWLAKKLKWERDKADDSNRRKRESEVEKARQDAEEAAISQQYTQAFERAKQAFGGETANRFTAILKHVAEKGMPENWDPKQYFDSMTNWLFDSTRTTVALDAADKRAKMLATQYPEWQASPETVGEWTRALQSRDPQKMDAAFMQAATEAAESKLKALATKDAAAKTADEQARKAKADELSKVER